MANKLNIKRYQLSKVGKYITSHNPLATKVAHAYPNPDTSASLIVKDKSGQQFFVDYNFEGQYKSDKEYPNVKGSTKFGTLQPGEYNTRGLGYPFTKPEVENDAHTIEEESPMPLPGVASNMYRIKGSPFNNDPSFNFGSITIPPYLNATGNRRFMEYPVPKDQRDEINKNYENNPTNSEALKEKQWLDYVDKYAPKAPVVERKYLSQNEVTKANPASTPASAPALSSTPTATPVSIAASQVKNRTQPATLWNLISSIPQDIKDYLNARNKKPIKRYS